MRASLRPWTSAWCLAGVLASAAHAGGGGGGGSGPVRYGRDVRPLLSDRCFVCHGPDAAERQADLRLDGFESATAERAGGAAIVPGDAEASLLWQRIAHSDPEERMPPADSNRRALSADERARIRAWIEAGAEYEPHWAFVAPLRPPLPAARGGRDNPVDRFLDARLASEGVAPSPAAPPETQLRRLFLDLTGLPPTPEELAQFLADPRPERYEAWVERLLDEEPYRTRHAERMATPWLDQARYADTSGIHMDAGRQMWLWRDWVLEAYRTNLPFDRFVVEQIAGDLLPEATVAQRIASGFHRNHVTTDEGGAIDEEYRVEYVVDRTATTGSVFLGLTLGCARCHEHKFDPISQQEFYRFYAFFDSNEEPGLYSQSPDANRALEPFLVVPTEAQATRRGELEATLAREQEELERPPPGEDEARASFFAELERASALAWATSTVLGARSLEGATLALQPDGSVLAAGTNPDQDEHELRLRTDATGLRLVALEALGDASFHEGRVGRAPNGNAVLSAITVEAVSVRDPARRVPVPLGWAWAEHEQEDGEFGITNALDPDPHGWAVGAHQRPGGRVALFLADEPFGFEGGTELVVRLAYRSQYAQHAFGRVRLALASLGPAGLDALPAAASDWLLAGPFPTGPSPEGYTASFGPELDLDLDRTRDFAGQSWRFVRRYLDGRLNGGLAQGLSVHYLGRRLFVPSARTVTFALGSDDGYRLFLDGAEVSARQVDRALAADQDRVELTLSAGTHTLVLAVVNTGGESGFTWRPERRPEELAGELLLAFLPATAREPGRAAALARAWRLAFSADYRARNERITALRAELVALEAATPRTMVMQERAEPRETFVLMRGAYDRPDKAQPVERDVPAVLGSLPEGAPRDRLGLAQWLVAPENPLVARVAVNRLWELVFGTGIVRTTEDFGLQGEWPAHPELLDWLAVEFRESGWDVQHVLRLLVTSAAYRQSSRARPELAERDPENRWLAWLPRRRLEAEAIRDQALYVAGLLVERAGGPSVKPYQPEGLWQEVAMIQSNTREYVRGAGDELWRRSLYTYWKRACPPPALLTFDAPTREFCTIRRASTNTPLQALVLWNDEQFVEAARALAARVLTEPAADDGERVEALFRRCAVRAPSQEERTLLAAALADFRARYAGASADARLLIEVGESPTPEGLDPVELAAWTLLANAILNLDEVITRS
ncbi:MAG TPA: PSD1 and planctomycete cytochrome C domain-containing protein [Planctomycetota bacterium]